MQGLKRSTSVPLPAPPAQLQMLGSVCKMAVSLSLATSQQGPGQPPAAGQGYLSGNFAPVGGEVFAHDLPVEGTLPAALNGVYIRNGPNPQFPPDTPTKHHWCAGSISIATTLRQIEASSNTQSAKCAIMRGA